MRFLVEEFQRDRVGSFECKQGLPGLDRQLAQRNREHDPRDDDAVDFERTDHVGNVFGAAEHAMRQQREAAASLGIQEADNAHAIARIAGDAVQIEFGELVDTDEEDGFGSRDDHVTRPIARRAPHVPEPAADPRPDHQRDGDQNLQQRQGSRDPVEPVGDEGQYGGTGYDRDDRSDDVTIVLWRAVTPHRRGDAGQWQHDRGCGNREKSVGDQSQKMIARKLEIFAEHRRGDQRDRHQRQIHQQNAQ